MSEAVTVPSVVMMTSIVSEESLARDTHTEKERDRDRKRQTDGLNVTKGSCVYYKHTVHR